MNPTQWTEDMSLIVYNKFHTKLEIILVYPKEKAITNLDINSMFGFPFENS